MRPAIAVLVLGAGAAAGHGVGGGPFGAPCTPLDHAVVVSPLGDIDPAVPAPAAPTVTRTPARHLRIDSASSPAPAVSLASAARREGIVRQIRIGGSVAIAILVAAAAIAADDNTLPANPADALARAQPGIEAARKAKAAETPDIAKHIRRAVDLMQPFARKSAANEDWSTLWNEALTLTRFHGNKPTADYTLRTTRIIDGIQAGLPVGRGWSGSCETPRPGHLRHYGGIQRTRPNGSVAVSISVCVYEFNTLYTGSGRQGGVGGENATGLAKEFRDYDRSGLLVVESGSTSIAAKPLSKTFSRAQYYEIKGKSKDAGTVRMRSWYAKTSTRTYAFDVTQFLDPVATDTPSETWQNAGEDPELDAVLASIEEVDEKGR